MNLRFDLSADAIAFDDASTALGAGAEFLQGAVQLLYGNVQVKALAMGLWTSTVTTQSLSSGAFTQLNLGTEVANSGHFTINGSNELETDVGLDFLFTFAAMNATVSSGNRGASRLTMSYDSGGGYATVDEGRAYLRNATGSTQGRAVAYHMASSPSSGFLVKIEGAITSGTGTTSTNNYGSRLFALGFSATAQ